MLYKFDFVWFDSFRLASVVMYETSYSVAVNKRSCHVRSWRVISQNHLIRFQTTAKCLLSKLVN